MTVAVVASHRSALTLNSSAADGQWRSSTDATGKSERHRRCQRRGSIAENRRDAGRCASLGGGLSAGGYRPFGGKKGYADETESGDQSAAKFGHVPSVVDNDPVHTTVGIEQELGTRAEMNVPAFNCERSLKMLRDDGRCA